MRLTNEQIANQTSSTSERMANVYDPAQLIRKWHREELTTEQAVGQTLLYIEALVGRVQELERYMERNSVE